MMRRVVSAVALLVFGLVQLLVVVPVGAAVPGQAPTPRGSPAGYVIGDFVGTFSAPNAAGSGVDIHISALSGWTFLYVDHYGNGAMSSKYNPASCDRYDVFDLYRGGAWNNGFSDGVWISRTQNSPLLSPAYRTQDESFVINTLNFTVRNRGYATTCGGGPMTFDVWRAAAVPTATPTATATPTESATATATATAATATASSTAGPTVTGTLLPLTPGCALGPIYTATPTKTPPGAATATKTPTGLPTWTPTASGGVVGSVPPPAGRITFDGGAPLGWDFNHNSGWEQGFGRGGANGAVWIGSNPEHTPYSIGVDDGQIYMTYLHSADWVMTGYYYIEGVPPSTRFYFDAASYGLWSFDNFTGWAVMWNPYLFEVGRDGGAWLPFTLANPHGPDGYELLRGDLMKLYLYVGGSFVPGVQHTEQFRIWFDDIQFKLAPEADQCPTRTPTATLTRTPTPSGGTYTPGPTSTGTPSRTSVAVTLVTPQTATATDTGTLPASGTPGGSLTPRPPGGTATPNVGLGTPFPVVNVDWPCNTLVCVEVGVTDLGDANPCIGYDSFNVSALSLIDIDIPGIKICFIRYEINQLRLGPWNFDWLLVLVLVAYPVIALLNMFRSTGV